MKKIFFCFALVLLGFSAEAKKVKFAVDMYGQVLDTGGMHIAGDFQTLAGYPGGDWQPGTTPLTNEPNSTIYSVVVDIPAFAKYEFVYINGEFGYLQEFVPVESRVNYNFNANRWIYVDSLSNDTQLIAPVLFGGNAPLGMYLLRFYVDMQNVAAINPQGVHVNGDFQNWTDPKYMISFDNIVYEYIAYIDTINAALVTEYIFMNGDQPTDEEIVPAPCATFNFNRGTPVPLDTMLGIVCFSACVDCASVGLEESLAMQTEIMVQPNPATDVLWVSSSTSIAQIQLTDMTGRLVKTEKTPLATTQRISRDELPQGIYLLQLTDVNGNNFSRKIIFQ
ncbi:MAG: T9SS type A sorting domain-containing protein [Bacteroidia bacterium]